MDDTFPDVRSLTDLQPKDVVRQSAEEETEIPYKRRILRPAPAARPSVRDLPALVARSAAARRLGARARPPLVGRSPTP
jgi:hypothetical protein